MRNPIEQRSGEHRFRCLMELIQYYRRYRSESQIELSILEAGRNFVSRTFGSPAQERLLFLKRCESGLEADCRRKECAEAVTRSFHGK